MSQPALRRTACPPRPPGSGHGPGKRFRSLRLRWPRRCARARWAVASGPGPHTWLGAVKVGVGGPSTATGVPRGGGDGCPW